MVMVPKSTVSIPTSTSDSGGCSPVVLQLEGANLPPVLIIDIMGLLGNIVALWIFCFKLKAWNPNHMFLFNLVIADFLFLVNLPLRVDALLRGHWVFGDGLCRIHLFLQFANRLASIAFMTAVAIHRYFKVVHPHHCLNRMTKQQAALVSLFIWMLGISTRFPILAYNHIYVNGNNTQCFFTYEKNDYLILTNTLPLRILIVLEFILPPAILLFCSIRISRFLKKTQLARLGKVRKVMQMCTAIAVVYMVCFLPNTVARIGLRIILSYRSWDCNALNTFTHLYDISFGLNCLNSALNPIIYVFSSSMFRSALLGALPPFLQCGRDTDENVPPAARNQSTPLRSGSEI